MTLHTSLGWFDAKKSGTAALGGLLVVSLALSACGGGGGGGVPLVPEAVVQSVANAQALEGQVGQTGKPVIEFEVALSKPVERGLAVSFFTSSTAKAGNESTGSAKGGVCGAPGVDYMAATSSQITIPVGVSTYKLQLELCPDADFEPNETFTLTWASAGASGGTVTGTIINDDVGGLNGTGATAVMTGLSAFGRDTHPLTNNSADGGLGFAFDKSGACVVDKVTGLTWQKLTTTNLPYTSLAGYVTTVNGQSLCGYTDWRVPTANELMNLMDISKATGSMANADYLSVAADAMAGLFWSDQARATTNAVDAWRVDAGSNGALSYGAKASGQKVRLVRGGRAQNSGCDNSDGRFLDHADGTVTDTATNLMWKKCPEGYTDSACTQGTVFQSNGTAASVVTQLAKANGDKEKGYLDWRVPSRNELASLVNLACNNPAIVTSVFPFNESLAYITSNVNVNASDTQVWSVDFREGNVGQDLLARNYRMRLVRAGQ